MELHIITRWNKSSFKINKSIYPLHRTRVLFPLPTRRSSPWISFGSTHNKKSDFLTTCVVFYKCTHSKRNIKGAHIDIWQKATSKTFSECENQAGCVDVSCGTWKSGQLLWMFRLKMETMIYIYNNVL